MENSSKLYISKHSSLEDFVHHFFFILLTALRTERDHKAAVMFQKVKVHPFLANSPESEYFKLLTSYALGFVFKQMKLAEKVKEIKENRNEYIVHTSESGRSVSLSHFNCTFNTAMSLPCQHMFALRAMLEKPHLLQSNSKAFFHLHCTTKSFANNINKQVSQA